MCALVAEAEVKITDAWSLGADVNAIGSQYLVGDQSNQNPTVPAYWFVNLHSSYQVTQKIEVFGLVRNLFNFGTFFQTDTFPNTGSVLKEYGALHLSSHWRAGRLSGP